MGRHKNLEKEADKIRFSLTENDHVKSMVAEIELLRTVSNYPLLFTAGPVLNNAIRRYETLFLPAVQKSLICEALSAAPLDIQWVWHCHMLSPYHYEQDMSKLIGLIPDHTILPADLLHDKHKTTHGTSGPYETSAQVRNMWNRFVEDGEPLDVDLRVPVEFPGGPEYTSQCSYDLISAVHRQSCFYYNVSLPHYRNDHFLHTAIHRYKMMLRLKLSHPEAFVVPCYDMDLAWHTHQLHPHLYKKDTTEYLGKMFNHDDNMTDRGPGSHLAKSQAITQSLWSADYNCNLALSGAMYRGLSPVGKLGYMYPQEEDGVANQIFHLNLDSLSADHSAAAKMKLVFSLNGKTVYKKKIKQDKYKHFNFGSHQRKLTLYDHGSGIMMLTLTQTPAGFCASSEREGDITRDLSQYIRRGITGGQEINITQTINKSNFTLNGSISAPRLGEVRLHLIAGPFCNVVMPELIESLWGPVPLTPLPPGEVNYCTVANHTLQIAGERDITFTVRAIHSLPLLMSAVQIYYRDRMIAVSHLVGTDTIPEHSKQYKNDKSLVTLYRTAGERAMIIKTADGDRSIIFAHWANMKKGRAGTRNQRGKLGKPGNLRIRVSVPGEGGAWHNYPHQDISGDRATLLDSVIDMKNGVVEFKTARQLGEKLALTFSLAVLNCLCQPPPPGITPPITASNLGVQPAPPRYRPIVRGTRTVQYSDSAGLLFCVASGWLMGIPTNHYIRKHHRRRRRASAGACGGACEGLAECAACGGETGDGGACAGDGGDDGGGCGGCGGGDGGGDGGGCGGGDCGGGCGGGD